MHAEDTLIDLLASCYGARDSLTCAESDAGLFIQAPVAFVDPQTAAFRSDAAVLNDLAISHRLSVLVGRREHRIGDDHSLAIKSMERLTETIDAVDGYQVSLHVELTREPNERVATLRSTLVARSGTEARSVVTLFNVLPPSLVSFVRRTRKFLDYANVRIDRAVPQLSALADGHFRYFPSEGDRLSDGARVDHVPALTMIDIALSVGTARNPGALDADISAQFLSYADPRQPFDIVPGDAHGVVAFMQNDQRVAEIRCRERVGA